MPLRFGGEVKEHSAIICIQHSPSGSKMAIKGIYIGLWVKPVKMLVKIGK